MLIMKYEEVDSVSLKSEEHLVIVKKCLGRLWQLTILTPQSLFGFVPRKSHRQAELARSILYIFKESEFGAALKIFWWLVPTPQAPDLPPGVFNILRHICINIDQLSCEISLSILRNVDIVKDILMTSSITSPVTRSPTTPVQVPFSWKDISMSCFRKRTKREVES